MNVTRWIVTAMLATTTFLLPACVLAADESPWYGGAGVGHSDAKRPGSWAEQADLAFRGQGVTSLTTINSGDTSWKLFGGYQYNEHVAVEAAYARLGKYGGSSRVTAPAAGSGAGTWDASAFSLAAVGSLPIHENRVAATGKLGLAYTHLDVNATATGGALTAVSNQSNDRVNLLLGVGIRFDLTKKFGVRAEYEHYTNVGDASKTGQTAIAIWSLGGYFRF